MTRYYYDCPISAAYMAKNFEVKFTDDTLNHYTSRESWVGFVDWARIDCDKIYIHPDSMAIFVPRLGDLVKATYNKECTFVHRIVSGVESNHYLVGGFPDYYGYPDYIGDGVRKIFKIIQREGKPFIWPQEEV